MKIGYLFLGVINDKPNTANLAPSWVSAQPDSCPEPQKATDGLGAVYVATATSREGDEEEPKVFPAEELPFVNVKISLMKGREE